MEATIIEVSKELDATSDDQLGESASLRELSSLELALVGGGTAVYTFG